MMMKEYPNVVAGSASPYFPPLYEKPDCAKCEKRRDCYSCGKYQRDRRDFTYTSGRCPRLPDMRGFVEKDERELYAQTFPLLHAERGGIEGEYTLNLSLSLPGEKRVRTVYRSNGYGVWWFRDGKDPETGYVFRRILHFDDGFTSAAEILERMRSDYCLFPVIVTDGYL